MLIKRKYNKVIEHVCGKIVYSLWRCFESKVHYWKIWTKGIYKKPLESL